MKPGRGLGLAASGLLLAGVGAGGGLLSAEAEAAAPTFGSYTLTATAPGFEMSEDQPSANAHPEGGGMAPYSTVALTNGPLGYALSSIAWPGATEANAGAVASLLFPSAIVVPVDGAPVVPVPDGLRQLALDALPLANYPIRAEARSGSQPDSKYEQIPGTTLTAHADPVLVQATGAVNGAEQPGAFTFGSASSITNAALDGVAGTASAASTMADIDFGGVIKIDSITSNATASTDGATGTSSGETLVSGVTIADQNAYFDETGLHIGSEGAPANAVVNQIAQQALSSAGFTVLVSQPQFEQQGALASYTAGSVIIVWKPPSNPNENVFVFALGGARVSVTATPGFSINDPRPTTPTVTSPVGTGSGSPTAIGNTSSGTPPAAGATPTTAPTAGPAPIETTPIGALFDGIDAPWVVLALAGTALMAWGSKRAADDIVFRRAAMCPLETS